MRVAALQFDVLRGDVDTNLTRVEVGLRQAAERGVALICLPEMWPTSFVELGDTDWLTPTRRALECIASLSKELDLVVCGSSFASAGKARMRNRLHVFERGEDVLAYDKVHLFTPTGERESFSAGDVPPSTVRVGDLKLSGVVCYDLRFGELFRAPFVAEAELYVVPAQWPAARASHWRALVLGRAAESQAYVIAGNRTGTEIVGRRATKLEFAGNSIVAGPDGTALAEGVGEDGLVVADLDLEGLRSLRREVPVRRDRRAEAYGRGPARGNQDHTRDRA